MPFRISKFFPSWIYNFSFMLSLLNQTDTVKVQGLEYWLFAVCIFEMYACISCAVESCLPLHVSEFATLLFLSCPASLDAIVLVVHCGISAIKSSRHGLQGIHTLPFLIHFLLISFTCSMDLPTSHLGYPHHLPLPTYSSTAL
jgi:hypothetical protein